MYYMSGPLDPNRVSTVELDDYLIFKRVRAIFKTGMPEDWAWGLKPFTRGNPPPQVNLHFVVCLQVVFVTVLLLTLLCFISRRGLRIKRPRMPRSWIFRGLRRDTPDSG